MRRIVVFNWLTADGYFAGPDGSLQLLPGGGSRRNRRGFEPLLLRQVLTDSSRSTARCRGSDGQSRIVNPNSRAAFNPSTLARPASERWPMVRSIASAE